MRRWSVIATASALLVGLVVAGPARADGVRYVDQVFAGVDVTRNIPYGAAVNSRGEVEQLELDLYKPVGDTANDRALYIWAPGSGFRYEDRNSIGPLRDYVTRGWVGMSITYRLRPELPANAFIGIAQHPEQLQVGAAAAMDAQHDMQAAVRWARAHADTLGINPDKIAVGGMSAGAIAALMVAFNPNDVGDSGTPGVSSAVAAAVAHAGAYVPVLQGALPAAGEAPVAMFHGITDEQVPYPTSPPACVLTILVGNTCEYVTYAFRGHETLGAELALDFLYRHVIVGRAVQHAPLVADFGDPIRLVAGIEPANQNLGVTLGLVTPTDPAVISDETLNFVSYVAGALGIPL